jgi:hypothetical protein
MLSPDHNSQDPTTWPTVAPECGWMVGVLEIWPILGVKQRSPHQWKRRGKLPPADYASVNGTEAWEVRTILAWAEQTGRLEPKIVDDHGHVDVVASEERRTHLAALFAATFGRDPDYRRRGVWPTREPVNEEPPIVGTATATPFAVVGTAEITDPTLRTTAKATDVTVNGMDAVLVEPRLKGDSKKRRSFRKPGVTA